MITDLVCFILISAVQLPLEQSVIRQDTVVQISNKEVYIAYPQKSSNPQHVLLALHGSGREARSYREGDTSGIPFYIHQRDLALHNGYLFVSVSNSTDTWGTDKGLSTVLEVYNYITATHETTPQWTFWGTSAGGVLMFRLIREYPEIVNGALATFPVYDLLDAFNRLESAQRAWKDPLSFEFVNPAKTPKAFINTPILIVHGNADKAVPVQHHSMRLLREIACEEHSLRLHVVSGGHDTSNMELYPDNIINEFINEIVEKQIKNP